MKWNQLLWSNCCKIQLWITEKPKEQWLEQHRNFSIMKIQSGVRQSEVGTVCLRSSGTQMKCLSLSYSASFNREHPLMVQWSCSCSMYRMHTRGQETERYKLCSEKHFPETMHTVFIWLAFSQMATPRNKMGWEILS